MLAQLAAFLLAHHHHVWACHLHNPRTFAHALRWALRHGFRYHPRGYLVDSQITGINPHTRI